MKITLQGDPKSTQHIYRMTCRGRIPTWYMTPEGKQIKRTYQLEARSQWRKPPRTDPLELAIVFYCGTKRKRDLDNNNKLILDALAGIVYEDDSQIEALHLYRFYDKRDPRIEIEII